MNRFHFIIAGAFMALMFSACVPKIIPMGDITDESMNFSSTVSKLQVGSGISVVLDPEMTDNMLIVSTNENIHKYVQVVQRQGALNISVNTYGMSMSSARITVTLSPDQFTSYTFSGGAKAVCEDGINAPFLSVELSGGSRLESDLESDKINLVLSGGSKYIGELTATDIFSEFSGGSSIEISGTCRNFNADCSGGSRIEGLDHTCENLDLVNSGGSVVRMTVLNSIVCNNSGGSKLYYKGDPDKIIINSSDSVIPL